MNFEISTTHISEADIDMNNTFANLDPSFSCLHEGSNSTLALSRYHSFLLEPDFEDLPFSFKRHMNSNLRNYSTATTHTFSKKIPPY